MTGCKIAALRVKGLRSIAAWLELENLSTGSLIGICGPNGTSCMPQPVPQLQWRRLA